MLSGICFGQTAPTISGVKFDGKTYFPSDMISNTPTIELLLSSEGASALQVEIAADSQGLYSGPANNGVFIFSVPNARKIPPGTHTIIISAVDSIGGSAEVFFEDLNVMGEPLKLSGLTAYHQVFSPEKSEQAIISYNLSDNTPLTVLFYNSSGDLILGKYFDGGDKGGKTGFNQIYWDGKDLSGHVVRSGYYVLKFIIGNKSVGTIKIIVMD